MIRTPDAVDTCVANDAHDESRPGRFGCGCGLLAKCRLSPGIVGFFLLRQAGRRSAKRREILLQ